MTPRDYNSYKIRWRCCIVKSLCFSFTRYTSNFSFQQRTFLFADVNAIVSDHFTAFERRKRSALDLSEAAETKLKNIWNLDEPDTHSYRLHALSFSRFYVRHRNESEMEILLIEHQGRKICRGKVILAEQRENNGGLRNYNIPGANVNFIRTSSVCTL